GRCAAVQPERSARALSDAADLLRLSVTRLLPMLRSTRALSLCVLLVSTPLLALDYRIETFSEGLENPWALAFLPDGRLLVTERVGRLRIIEADGSLNPQPIGGVPEGFVAAQAGLMEV